ncbi:MAG: hypothetical protein UX91_C0007G0109 [Candidatus Amesbacteria bacterium GW2011_GWB1_47_19]|nr:MAG: hypothetical protein UW51_C0006G0070 [Candidatus Amesbacteria bacterium GW2011_GWA1_44_24]KKU31893.1 MAG: hypothetical protein UX46_C0002G0109 [Candidatus Amesbacteria bacterium GW2011_GWC1_46_24]KKU66829.1 MAG: hypothetical protein UX91_C0007G0109 [Candidatus Amesbacteria bacterium GW2011_GWB1_47_19]OGD05269.1 MAG: hypothetical protein A2379_03655 [Candidatus Amesbacteria bacterium RIFOXYB1_FULL_47_13]HBC73191.1 hypothetical protein [Candidatus Amesbacteria bacterium]
MKPEDRQELIDTGRQLSMWITPGVLQVKDQPTGKADWYWNKMAWKTSAARALASVTLAIGFWEFGVWNEGANWDPNIWMRGLIGIGIITAMDFLLTTGKVLGVQLRK